MKRLNDYSPILPLILIALVLVLQSVSQTLQLVNERARLAEIKQTQGDSLRNAGFARSDLEKLVTATLNLAQNGDRNVLPVIDRMKQIGLVTTAAQ